MLMVFGSVSAGRSVRMSICGETDVALVSASAHVLSGTRVDLVRLGRSAAMLFRYGKAAGLRRGGAGSDIRYEGAMDAGAERAVARRMLALAAKQGTALFGIGTPTGGTHHRSPKYSLEALDTLSFEGLRTSPGQKGEEVILEGHPQAPGKTRCTPPFRPEPRYPILSKDSEPALSPPK